MLGTIGADLEIIENMWCEVIQGIRQEVTGKDLTCSLTISPSGKALNTTNLKICHRIQPSSFKVYDKAMQLQSRSRPTAGGKSGWLSGNNLLEEDINIGYVPIHLCN